jgi:tetratricopeptide (TPR) repeat protein
VKELPLEPRRIKARVIELNTEGTLAKDVSGGPVVNEKNEVIGIIADVRAQSGNLLCIDVAEARPALCGAYRKLAMQALEKRNYDKAIAYSEQGLAYFKGDAMTWNERGAAFSMKDQYDKAIADYSEAIKIDPKFARALVNRASAYLHLGKYQEAVADCSTAADAAPKFVQAYTIRLQAYRKLNQKDKAELDERILRALRDTGDWRMTGSSGSKPPG